jgi:RNA polymerase sigma-70 factor, ECF subfamily
MTMTWRLTSPKRRSYAFFATRIAIGAITSFRPGFTVLPRRERKGRFSLRQMIGLFEKDGKPLPIPDVRPSPERALDGKQRLERLQAAVDSLPPKYRLPFLLKEVEDLSYEEICNVLQISMGTVKSRIHRAKMLLREKLVGIL